MDWWCLDVSICSGGDNGVLMLISTVQDTVMDWWFLDVSIYSMYSGGYSDELGMSGC
jgi:hypothetical protein